MPFFFCETKNSVLFFVTLRCLEKKQKNEVVYWLLVLNTKPLASQGLLLFLPEVEFFFFFGKKKNNKNQEKKRKK